MKKQLTSFLTLSLSLRVILSSFYFLALEINATFKPVSSISKIYPE